MAQQAPQMFDLSNGTQAIYSQPVIPPENSSARDHFWTSSHWSPDGLSLAVVDNNRHVHTWLLPQDSFMRNTHLFEQLGGKSTAAAAAAASSPCPAPSTLPACASSLHEAEYVDAFAWHPSSCVSNPAWCVFATGSKDQPVHLWDALTGKVRANRQLC